jgi:acyl-CoA synthetase (AMP-forming)/AMP-acid ligase II
MMERRSDSIVEAFARNAGRTATKLCLRFADDEWTYGSLRERVENFVTKSRVR